MTRIFSPYEQEHLRRFDHSDLENDCGEMPVEYITGKVEFGGLVFKVTRDTLIPRVESEEIVRLGLDFVRTFPSTPRLDVADIGCGCGALGISLVATIVKRQPQRQITLTLTDNSEKALEVARGNAQKLLPDTVQTIFHQSDLLERLNDESFDVILANLPYIPSARIPSLDESVREFEPLLALDGGPDGTEIIRRFLIQTPPFLKPGGLIILEVDDSLRPDDLLPEASGFEIEMKRDLFGRNRFALLNFTPLVRKLV